MDDVVFKKMLGALGVGGPSVDTVLADPNVQPGSALNGRVDLLGGTQDADIEHITLSLVTRMEVESGDSDHSATGQFHHVRVSGPMRLAAGQRHSIPFQIAVPWETPITAVYGQQLRGMVMGVRTELAIARAIDKGDLDPINVHPLPVQQRILDAFAQLGFGFKHADLEYGRIAGVPQTLPFFQEIEYYPAQQYARGINEVELTFISHPNGVEIVLEFDKRGGLFTSGRDTYGRYSVSHHEADTVDWAQRVDGWVRQALEGRQSMPGFNQGYGQQGYGQPGYGQQGYGGHGHHGGRGHGSGLGGMAAGVVGGLAAGFVAGEIMDDMFGGDEGGEE